MAALLRQLLATILSLFLAGPAFSNSFNESGNRTQKVSTLPGYPGGLSNYNANDQLATDTYDNDGNTTASNGLGYVYDFENHLVQAGGGITIVYDGDGNRVSKMVAGVTTTYVVDTFSPTGYAQVVTEKVSGASPQSYVYGLERIAHFWQFYDSTRGWVYENVYFVYDGHGSVRALTDKTGTVTGTYDYDAFGNLIHSTGSTPNNYLFAGEQFDPDLNLYYNRARYLNVSTGRFWNVDTEEGNDEEPLSLHKYLYSEGNPINNVDPSGNEIDEIAVGSMSETLDSMPSLNSVKVVKAALPIPPYPASKAARQLVGAIYAESSTPATGGEFPNEKIAIAETFIDEAIFATYYPKYNKSFGDGTLWSAIIKNSVAVGSGPWNQIMDGTSATSDLKSPDILNKVLPDRASRFHLLGSVLTADEFAGVGGAAGIFPLLDDLKGRIPVAFNKASNSPPSKREEKIGRIGTTTFYGFKLGREVQ